MAAERTARGRTTVVIVSVFPPSALGTGGHHRSYQIAWDARHAADGAEVVSLTWPSVRSVRDVDEALGVDTSATVHRAPDLGPVAYAIDRVRRGTRKVAGNWFQLVSPTRVVLSPSNEAALVACYRRVVAAAGGRVVCIVEHPCFQAALRVNQALGIPTIAAFHNLESLDAEGPLDLRRPGAAWARLGDLRSELNVLHACDERLFISNVEAGFVGGVGISARYYPYRPVGVLADWLARVRAKRAARGDGDGRRPLFLLLGSAVHGSTASGFAWFLERVRRHGLPEGAELQVVGAGTERLSVDSIGTGRVRARGWLREDELEPLLVAASAAILPQRDGFGAVTRLSELSAAGVPVLTSEHATFAAGPLPGVHAVDDDWASWHEALDRFRRAPVPTPPALDDGRVTEENALRKSLTRLTG
jgi:hypothetical protein